MNKLLILVALVFLLNTTSTCQVKEKLLTDAEQFSLKSGILLEREFIDIDKLKGIDIQVIKFKDLASGISKSALRLEKQKDGKYSSGSSIVSIDAEEIDDLVRAINNLKANVFPTTRVNYTEVTFKSKTEFEAGAYYSDGRWSGYLRLDKYSNDAMVFMALSDFDTLLAILDKAKTKM